MQVFDFHNDFLTSDKPFDVMCDYEKTSNKVVSAIFKGKRSEREIKDLVNCFVKFSPKNCFLAFEDISYDRHTADLFLDCNPVCVSLTWNDDNFLACGCHASGGLKKEGERVINECNKKLIAVDTAHLNSESFFEVVEKSKIPVNTHSCFISVNQNRRNLSDEQIRAIISKNGIIGLNLYSEFLTCFNQCDAESVFKHIDYFCQKFSYEYLAIGTDFFGCNSFPRGINGYENFDLIDEQMEKAGYSSFVRKRILFGNLDKFISQLLKARLSLRRY